jgi:hypothetical protein
MSEIKLLLELNRMYVAQITDKVICQLEIMTDKNMLQSGEDSGLKNVWEEYCVQVQDEESFLWEAYRHTISQCIGIELDKQPLPVKKILSYISGLDMNSVTDEEQFTYIEEAAIKGILDEISNRADSYTNENIERYIARENEEHELENK